MQRERENYINSVNLNINTDFPYLVLHVVNDESYPRNPGFQVMHWHEDLQFIYVLEGAVEVRTLDDVVKVLEGEGLFINKNVVHYVRRLGSCRYNSFLFPEHFLGFYGGSPAKPLVDSVISNEGLAFLRFAPAVGWQKDIISILGQLTEVEKNRNEFYEYEVLVRLCEIWLIMVKNVTIPPGKKENTVQQRMQKVLRFIEFHYGEELTLDDLAKSANISKSECARCFRVSLGSTPYKYLTEFRLSRAAELLKNTDEPIGKIAAEVGFRQMSHFGKCFRDKTGFSPRQYREREG